MKAFNVLAVVILTIAWWMVYRFMFGVASLAGLAVWTIMGWFLAALVVLIAKKVNRTVWIIHAGLIILAVLVLPDAALVAISSRLPSLFEDPMTGKILLTYPISIIVAAMLIYSGLTLNIKNTGLEDDMPSQPQYRRTRMASAAALTLSVFILATMLYNFYWFMVWDTTGDSIEYLWLPFPILAVLFSSAVLINLLPGKIKLAGLSYLLLIPALIGITARAQSVDFRQLTATHAEQVRGAIEAYHAREGSYPQNLQQLIPRYAILLPRPVIIFGQEWCYQGGEDYYRLGYLDREHWSSPILFGRVYSSEGHFPLKADICQPAIDTFWAQHPGWDQVLKDYGRPTPTPDLGE